MTTTEKTMGDNSQQRGLQMSQHQDITMSEVTARPATLMVLCNVHTRMAMSHRLMCQKIYKL